MEALARLQLLLEFHNTKLGPQFETPHSLGRMGVGGLVIGAFLGAHACLLGFGLGDMARGAALGALTQWALYGVALGAFHASEFLLAAIYRPDELNYDSMLINHSPQYTAAALAAWLEFALETALAPALKARARAAGVALGLALVGAGLALRVAAQRTAGAHFAHQIMTERTRSHKLVTHGVYATFRHPAYCGWFWWSIGTQLLLANPLALVAYALAAWSFFRNRIPHEEAYLRQFYGKEYAEYARRTYTGIPFIS